MSEDEIETVLEYSNLDYRYEFAKENLSISVVALDIESGEYVNTYPSAHEAENAINIPDANGHIIACCKGEIVSCYGYKWCYESDYIDRSAMYYAKISASVSGRRPIVALDIKTGDLIKKYVSITEALTSLNKKGGGSISLCCSGKLNYCYGYRWMYEDEYLVLKDNIYEIIKEKEKIKQKNRSKCRSVPVVIVWEGEVIKKSSIKEISDYMAIQYGIVNVKNWFKSRGVPQKYSDKVSFCGTLDDFKNGAE